MVMIHTVNDGYRPVGMICDVKEILTLMEMSLEISEMAAIIRHYSDPEIEALMDDRRIYEAYCLAAKKMARAIFNNVCVTVEGVKYSPERFGIEYFDDVQDYDGVAF